MEIASEILCWTFTFGLLLGGLIATPLPIVPGPLIILGGGVLFRLWHPEGGSTWWGVGIMALIVAIAYVVEFLSSAAGARWFGASKWGVMGAIVGGIVGLFFSLPGLILGPIIGAFSFELIFAKKKLSPATKSTVGTVVGTLAGIVLKTILAIAMIATFLLDTFLWD